MDKKKLIHATLAAMVAAGMTLASMQGLAASKKFEKCYGIVKKGMNDCGTPKHACAAQAKKSGDGEEWMYVPKGSCDKIVGGSTKPMKDKDTGDSN